VSLLFATLLWCNGALEVTHYKEYSSMKRRIAFALIAAALALGVVSTPADAGRNSKTPLTSIGSP